MVNAGRTRCSVFVTGMLLCSTLACGTSHRRDNADSTSRDDRLTEAEVLQSQTEQIEEEVDVLAFLRWTLGRE